METKQRFPPRQEGAKVLCFRQEFESTRVQFPKRWVTAINRNESKNEQCKLGQKLRVEYIVESLIVHDVVNDDND